MIKTQTCHTIHCDGDGCDATIEHDYEPHFGDPQSARDEATDAFEWWCENGVDVCATCKIKSHAFVPEDPAVWPNSNDCARCGFEREEHELEPAKA